MRYALDPLLLRGMRIFRICANRRCVDESVAAALRKIIEAIELVSASVKSEAQQVFALSDRKVVSFIERIKRPAAVVIDAGSNDQRATAIDNHLIGGWELRRVASRGSDVRERNPLR